MPSPHRLARLTLVVLALATLPTVAMAENKVYDFELGGFYTFVRFDGENALEYKLAPSVLFAYNFTRRHGIEAMGTLGSTTPDGGNSYRTDFGILRVGYNYNVYPREKITSLFRIGVGRFALDPVRERDSLEADASNDQSFLFYLGGGVRFFLKDWMAIRVSGSMDIINRSGGIGKSDTQAVGDVGLVFFLGEKAPAAEPPPAAPKPEEAKPEEEKKPEAGEAKPPRL